MSIYCVSERCVICGFEIQNGDSMVAALLEVLACGCRPWPTDSARRMRWLRKRFSVSLEKAKPSLPLEIWLEIAEHLRGDDLHRCVMAPSIHTLLKDAQTVSSQVSTSAEIWTRFVSFEGVRYISSLSNSRDEYHSQSIYAPDTSHDLDVLYIAQTPLGVTQLLFANSSQASDFGNGQGEWWKVVELLNRSPILITKTDDFIFYEGHKDGIWMHLPVKHGEKITEIWSLHHSEGPPLVVSSSGRMNAGTSLIPKQLKTSHGRVCFFGTQPFSPEAPRARLLDLPPQDGEIHIFFDNRNRVESLFFEEPEPTPGLRSDPVLPDPISPRPPHAVYKEQLFFSSASLDGIIQIIPCRRHARGRSHVVGLLLEYSDGRRTCVGQFRLDSLDKRLLVRDSRHIWMGFYQDEKGPLVSAVELSESHLEQDGVSWLGLELTGGLH
ncbi:hypothetical protein CPLU01_01341 [Colletotrichum plurivorum]|uniref:Uncharacterized protein n=1 Tax=Colletotrichum plurivorum TaxID=2175906 RepID=A0A8H6NPR1_9PEZI|nr:hypothetical protein CPLU01_01341 [Colletotrichum plurivorum]